MASKGGSSTTLARIFVRIGALRRFHLLTRKTRDLPVEVAWDRRRANPADVTEANPSGGPDRRRKPPYTWEVADFVVVENPSDEQDVPASKD